MYPLKLSVTSASRSVGRGEVFWKSFKSVTYNFEMHTKDATTRRLRGTSVHCQYFCCFMLSYLNLFADNSWTFAFWIQLCMWIFWWLIRDSTLKVLSLWMRKHVSQFAEGSADILVITKIVLVIYFLFILIFSFCFKSILLLTQIHCICCLFCICQLCQC